MDTLCANGKLQKGPAQGGRQYLAVLAAVPPRALGSLSQLASGGVAAAVRALLWDRDGLKPSQKLPERPFPSFLGVPAAMSPWGKTTASPKV